MLETIRILLIDAHPVVRVGLKSIIQSQPGFEVAAEAGTLDEALALATGPTPDLVVIDPVRLESNGRDSIVELKQVWPGCKVVVFAGRAELATAKSAIQSGASGYFLKASPREEVLLAIRTAMAGGHYIDPAIAAAILGGASANEMNLRESHVLAMISRGFSNKEIAVALGVSQKTCEVDKKSGM